MSDERKVLNLWMELFNLRSFYNEIPGQILLHVILGQKLKYLKIITRPGEVIDYRINFGHVQDSGSGKGKGLEYFLEISRKLTRPTKELKFEGKFKIEQLTGNVTDAALLDSNKQKGLLSNTDIIFYPEARPLFDPSKWNSSLKDIMISVMEPIGSEGNIFTKRLNKYDFTISTQSSASLIFTTRPIPNIRGSIPIAGHLQRAIFYPRELDEETRKKMNQRNREIIEIAQTFNYEKKEKELAQEIEEICQKVVNNPPKIENIQEFMNILNSKILEFEKKIEDIPLVENKQIANTFLARYIEHLLKLSHHSAVMRRSEYVNSSDLEYAFRLMEEVFKQLCLWIENSVERDWRVETDRERKFKQIKEWITRIEASKGIMSFERLSQMYANQYAKTNIAGRQFIENHQSELGIKIIKKEGTPTIVKLK